MADNITDFPTVEYDKDEATEMSFGNYLPHKQGGYRNMDLVVMHVELGASKIKGTPYVQFDMMVFRPEELHGLEVKKTYYISESATKYFMPMLFALNMRKLDPHSFSSNATGRLISCDVQTEIEKYEKDGQEKSITKYNLVKLKPSKQKMVDEPDDDDIPF